MGNCFFIEPHERRVFANLTLPRKNNHVSAAVLLCYPFGQEYMRAHRAYRQLANLLNRRGFAVMRFDYPGCGDSYGLAQSTTFNQWVDGAKRAVQELKHRSGKSDIYLVGLRLGSLVAAELSCRCTDVKQLVLWDPFASGESYLEDCRKQISEEVSDDDQWWLHGFPMSKKFRDELQAIDLIKMNFRDNMQVHQIISHENRDTKALASQHGPRVSQTFIPSPGDWNYVDMEGSILIPTELIKAICSALDN